MIRSRTVYSAISAMLIFPTATMAEEAAKAAASKPAVPSMGELLDGWGITTAGHIDFAYTHANRTPTGRVFDTERNSFNIHQAALTIAKQPKEGAGALLNVTAGEDASLLASTGLTSNSFDLTQAFMQFASGPLTVHGGKFATLAGTEVIASPGNANYSRSILFGSVPFTHTGLRAVYAMDGSMSFTVGLNNGWDQVKDTNAQKTLELGANLTPYSGLAIAVSNYYGVENTSATTHGGRNLFDLVGTFTLSDTLTVGAEYLNYRQKKFLSITSGNPITGKYQGLAGYVSFQVSDVLKLSGRAEWFDDKDGVRFGQEKNKVKELTVTLGYALSKNAEIRAEVRGDRASKAIYNDSNGVAGKTLTTYGLQALLKF